MKIFNKILRCVLILSIAFILFSGEVYASKNLSDRCVSIKNTTENNTFEKSDTSII